MSKARAQRWRCLGLRTRIPTPGLTGTLLLIVERSLASSANKQRSQITGNSGRYYAAWQLSRRGWHVMPTVRNARGSDLVVVNDDETAFLGIQSKALSKRSSIGLGLSLDTLRSDWWVLTVGCNSTAPVCYVLSLEDVRRIACRDKGGKRQHWLEPRDYERDEFREAWHRIGMSAGSGV